MTIPSLLALFSLLTLSCLTYFAANRLKTPYTVLLVAVGLLLVPLTDIPLFAFLKEFKLTPELLFYIFLPILIFESAYNIRIRKLQENIISISLLSVLSLLISTAFIAFVLQALFGLIGMPMPFIVLLLFGALISATDPVAVLALFKQYGAPRRLSLIFEGESLFNDGTAVALFLIILEISIKGYSGVGTLAEGLFLFTSMVVGGVVFGLVMGGLFAKLIQATHSNENVSIILMLVLAHLTFMLAEVISHHLVIGGHEIKVSAIIATTVASMVLGNYGRYKIAPQAEEFVEKFWGQFAFIANSLVFILIGLLFAALPINIMAFLTPIAITIAVVAIGRALSIYPVIGLLNNLKWEAPIPLSWQHLLAWGSLRGALAITMVLLIPDDWSPAGWAYSHSPKEFILGLTIGCIYATLFIKAVTIGPMIQKLNLNALTDVEKLSHRNTSAYLEAHVLQRLETLEAKGYIDAASHAKVKADVQARQTKMQKRYANAGKALLAETALNIHALGIERYYLHDLFLHDEITDRIMRRLEAVITNQMEKLEHGEVLAEHPGSVRGDWLEQLVDACRACIPHRNDDAFIEKFLYYRAKVIITRKVIKELTEYSQQHVKLFTPDDAEPVLSRYRVYNKAAKAQIEALLSAHGKVLQKVNADLAQRAVTKHQNHLLDDLLHKELVTPKVHISLKDELDPA